ncbi:DNA-packaging protein [Paenibacillus oralis]|uniref:DNA-packaging protein n=1 Tax=Paenibacillus oralis TaxID=2490856 RepID=A0A3P3TYQ3_9BACL|nr:phage head-tail connector protein [Paenibacillus oralis]RRJ62408.1 DNA-packaging protein [Paenibacillus oralis]
MTRQEQEAEVLGIVKARLKITDDTDDTLINSYITEIGWRILNICNRRDIPDALIYVWASMVIDVLRIEQPQKYGGDANSSGLNIKIGDTSVGPASKSGLTATSKSVIDQVVFDYRADLYRWRKMKW